jgi:hypothetical protein
MIDFEDLALEILEDFADSYSEFDKERLIGLLKSIQKETAKEYHDKMYRDIEMHNFENGYDAERMIDANDDTLRDFGVKV